MKNIMSIVLLSTFVLGATNSLQASETCPYDVVGNTVVSPTNQYQFLPDDRVTYGMAKWWEDDVYACYQTFRNPAYFSYFTGCDRDNSGTVEYQEVFDMYFFLISYQTGGTPTHSYQCPSSSPEATCDDLAILDFEAGTGPIVPLGVGAIEGVCDVIRGNEIPEGITLHETIEDCKAACFPCTTDDDCGGAHEYCKFTPETQCGSADTGYCQMHLGDCGETAGPVCTCNFTTVESACEAQLLGLSIQSEGACAQSDVCNQHGGSWNASTSSCDCPAGTLWNPQQGCEQLAPTCDDLSAVDFAAGTGPSLPLGAGVKNGVCVHFFGNEIPEGVSLFANTDACEAACFGCHSNDDCPGVNTDGHPTHYCKYAPETQCGTLGPGRCEPRYEVCSGIYLPVCTCNFTIQANDCTASMHGETVLFEGECSQRDICNNNGGSWNETAGECECPAGTEPNYMRGCDPIN